MPIYDENKFSKFIKKNYTEMREQCDNHDNFLLPLEGYGKLGRDGKCIFVVARACTNSFSRST
jgi:hypothetical protein